MKLVLMLAVLAFAVSFAPLDQVQAKSAMHTENVEQTLMKMEQNMVDALVKGDVSERWPRLSVQRSPVR